MTTGTAVLCSTAELCALSISLLLLSLVHSLFLCPYHFFLHLYTFLFLPFYFLSFIWLFNYVSCYFPISFCPMCFFVCLFLLVFYSIVLFPFLYPLPLVILVSFLLFFSHNFTFLILSNSFLSFYLLFVLTTWPSGLRRVTRNHFSSGGVGSNPAVVVLLSLFYRPLSPVSFVPCFYPYYFISSTFLFFSINLYLSTFCQYFISFLCLQLKWGLWRESNPRHLHPKQVFFHLTTKPFT